MPRSRPLRKVDARSLEARRLKALVLGIGDPEIQLAQAKRLAACLALEIERLECMQRNSELIDPDLLVRCANAYSRALDSVRELTPKRNAYWESEEAKAERLEREAWLATLDEAALLALREQVSPPAPPRPVPTHDIEVATREHEARVSAQRARTHTVHRPTSSNKKSASDKQERADQGQGAPTFDVTQSLIEVLS